MIAGKLAFIDHSYTVRDADFTAPDGKLLRVKALTFRERDSGLEAELLFSQQAWEGFQRWVAEQGGGIVTAGKDDLRQMVERLPAMAVPGEKRRHH